MDKAGRTCLRLSAQVEIAAYKRSVDRSERLPIHAQALFLILPAVNRQPVDNLQNLLGAQIPSSRQTVLIELTGKGVYQACDRFIDLNSLQMEPSSHTKAE